jgi:glycosyltransferase involved in cell wall biosynthesis
VVELPYGGASLKAVLGNLWHVLFLKGIIHVTGDVYYIGLIPLKKTILTIHDVNFFHGTFLKRILLKWFWLILPVSLATRITVISNFTRHELLKLTPWVKKKVKVIYNPVNPLLLPSQKLFKHPPVILHIGTKHNKNLINTIKGLEGIDCQLIIVGTLIEAQEQALIENKINFRNFVNLSFLDIKSLYENCDIVSVISFYEGFGMPIIEAQKVGRAVITSNRASIPEIVNKSAVLVNPDNISAIKNGFTKIISDENFRGILINSGSRNVARFEIQSVVFNYSKLYKQMSKY